MKNGIKVILGLAAVLVVVSIFLYILYGEQTKLAVAPESDNISTVSIIARGLDTPWAIAFLPDKSMLVTERSGKVRYINPSGRLEPQPVADLPGVKEYGEGGLLGIALHPDFSVNSLVYFYYTYSGSGDNTLNRVVRMNYSGHKLTNEVIIIDAIPGGIYHDGGRIKFGPDGFLYVTTGDGGNPSLAQDKNSLGGKILRTTDDGSPASGNPFGNLVYSYGHRNPQGLAWDGSGNLWETEHGPSGAETGNDEINKIEPGKNYGWPVIRGMQRKTDMETPVKESGAGNTWAPAGSVFYDNSLFFGGLRGESLYRAVIENGEVVNLKEYFKGRFGRMREATLGPDGMLYITTSNKDGRGNPNEIDDKIIRVNAGTL